MRWLKEWKEEKVGDIFNTGKKSATNFFSQGYAEYVEEEENKEVKTKQKEEIKSNTPKPNSGKCIRFIKDYNNMKKGDEGEASKKSARIFVEEGFAEYIEPEETKKLSNKNIGIKALEIAGIPKREAHDSFSRRGQANNFTEKQPVFYDQAKLWWVWIFNSAPSWQMCDEVEIINMVYQHMGIQGIETKERTEILNALKQVGRSYAPQPAPKTWIQFKNGIIDITDNNINLKKPDKNFFITNPLAWNLGENEDTPQMDKIFTEWVGEKNKIQLYEILAYCMLPDCPIHRMFILLGGGLNGKSKFLQLLRKFIGENNCSSTELDKLTGGNSRFEFTRFHKKLVCTMGETNFNEMKSTSVLKSLTGQDNIAIEYKGKNHIDYVNYAKIILATNNLPTTNDKTIGFYRRPIIIDFPNEFNEKKDILLEIPNKEYENLGMKCIKILKKILIERVFTSEGTIEERMKRYEDKSNPFDKFFQQNINESDPDSFITLKQFKQRFDDWCGINKFRKFSDIEINNKMKERGIEKNQKRVEWYINEEKKSVNLKCWISLKWKD